jgi:MinD-like ATPase involved in chromosome partitioning or flagellar assembly
MLPHAHRMEGRHLPVSGVHFTDGFDRPDTIAFGLDAPRLVTVVVAALSAYAVMQAPLPFALRVGVAVLLTSTGALLGWTRYAGRPLLTWAWLGLRFALSPRSGGGVAVSHADPVDGQEVEPAAPAIAPSVEPPAARDPELPPWARWLEVEDDEPAPAQPSSALPPETVETSRAAPLVVVMDEPAATAPDDALPPAVIDLPRAAPPRAPVLHLPLGSGVAVAAPIDSAAAPVFVGAPRRVTFFSLKGGSGRTTLATEVACILAARGRHLAADGTVRPLQVALLDLDLRSASVAVRLGIAQPTLADYLTRGGDPAQLSACMVRHGTGLRVLLGPPKPVASGPAALEPARVAEIVHRLERDGVHFVVIDVAADLGAVTTWVLSAAHDVFVVITPTAGGVQDAYRSTEALRRLGLGHKLRYVVNRARSEPDLDEVMGDLGGRVAAVIPDDAAVEDAENQHRVVALDTTGPAAAALHDLAALLYPSLAPSARRARLGWLPWRRRVG